MKFTKVDLYYDNVGEPTKGFEDETYSIFVQTTQK
jgi:hypothetical protein